MTVLVTGASGLVGSRLVARLRAAAVPVRAFVRAPGALGAPVDGGLSIVTGEIEDLAAVRRGVQGCGAVVHLANASGVTDEARVRAVNVGGTEHVLVASREAGVGRVIFTSSVSAMRARLGPYGRSKRMAEDLVRASGLPFVILRPSLVYGGDAPGLMTLLARHLRTLPVMPVIGDGRMPLDPIHVDDLCGVIEACLTRDDVLGRTYDVLGPDRVTLDELLTRLGASLGVHRPRLHLPAGAALLLARVLGRVMARPPLTVDNVLGMTSPARVDGSAAARDFPIAWTRLDVGLQGVVGS